MKMQSWNFAKQIYFWLYDFQAPLPFDPAALLSATEKQRAAQMGSEKRAQTFLLGRALLRWHLGAHLALPAGSLEFTENPQGKLAVKVFSGLFNGFSLSHSHERILIAIGGRGLGVDLEFVDADQDLEIIVRNLFSDHEKAQLEGLYGRDWKNAVLKAWCLKEARFKLLGSSEDAPNLSLGCGELDGNYVYAFAAS